MPVIVAVGDVLTVTVAVVVKLLHKTPAPSGSLVVMVRVTALPKSAALGV